MLILNHYNFIQQYVYFYWLVKAPTLASSFLIHLIFIISALTCRKFVEENSSVIVSTFQKLILCLLLYPQDIIFMSFICLHFMFRNRCYHIHQQIQVIRLRNIKDWIKIEVKNPLVNLIQGERLAPQPTFHSKMQINIIISAASRSENVMSVSCPKQTHQIFLPILRKKIHQIMPI